MDALEDLDDSGDSFGAKMVRWSMGRAAQYPMAQENGKKGGRPRKESTAGAPTREDGVDSKSLTPATIYGDDDTSDGSDVSTTVSTNIGNDQETEARQRKAGSKPRRTPPEVSRESGNNFESAIAEALQKARTGGDSVRRVGVASPAVCHKSAGAPVRMPSWPEFLQYVNANNIDYSDAREWFEMSIVDRDGKDREGNAIKNWKAALKAFCRSKEASRRKTA
jgi:hypothetical protein